MALEVAMEANHPLMEPHHMEVAEVTIQPHQHHPQVATVDLPRMILQLHQHLPRHQTLPQEEVGTITHHHLLEVVVPPHQSL